MKESSTLELKKSTSVIREAIESITAFANTDGGELYFGIADNGEVIGIPYTDETLRRIANEIKLNTEPKLFPSLDYREIDGKQVIRVQIDESPLKPHLAYGRAFVRVGTTNQKIDQQRYEYMLLQRNNGYGFDYVTCPNAQLSDLDTDAIYSFAETANLKRNANIGLYQSPLEILDKLDLHKDQLLSNAAILLFANNPGKFFDFHYEVKLGVFPDDVGYDPILNEQEFSANLIKNYENLFSSIMMQLNKSVQIDGLISTERYEYPPQIIREAIVNMIVHRDYRQGIKSTVEIRPRSIKFYNPAQLFGPTITIENLAKHHPSRPGNKNIAKVFYLMGLFENWGGGTNRIYEHCKSSGKPAPIFAYENGMFELTLMR